ncbi:MAG: hypothetical protein AAGD25_13160 [Cyanobacteria bacterium P01_F01_bin.150]
MVQTHHHQKIDLGADYPCPSCQRGRLFAITLTEALGCEQCQRIFVLNDSGYSLERLATTYPQAKQWSWTGQQWSVKRPPKSWFNLSSSLLIFFVVGICFSVLFASALKWGIIWAGSLALAATFITIVLRSLMRR